MGLTYVPVARVGEVAAGTMKPIEMGGRELLLANVDGSYFAFARECPHEAADLEFGELSDHQICCASHGYRFDLATGECTLPKGGPRLTTLPVEVRGEEICVKIEW
ncbi:MAG TPA: Rieske 2Fe-2S domain-containing protein [Candidatus Acidoferrales bacterium]|nr:Rieske 2Fe-2S domain-containing protein [Candidatus Acidoferrales bacterium]